MCRFAIHVCGQEILMVFKSVGLSDWLLYLGIIYEITLNWVSMFKKFQVTRLFR